MHWRRKWQPTPVFLLGESQGRGSLVGCRLWGRTELDTTKVTQQQQQQQQHPPINYNFLISRLVLQKRIYIVMMMMLSYEAAMETCVFLPLISLSPKFCFLLFISYP